MPADDCRLCGNEHGFAGVAPAVLPVDEIDVRKRSSCCGEVEQRSMAAETAANHQANF
jgi:hypothetical protein